MTYALMAAHLSLFAPKTPSTNRRPPRN